MHVDILDLPILATAGIAILMALNFLLRKPDFRIQVLGLMFFCAGNIQFLNYLIQSKNILLFANFFFFCIPVMYIIGPLQYFFVLSILNLKNSWSKKDLLHFIPMLLSVIHTVSLLIMSSHEKTLQLQKVYTDAPTPLVPAIAIILIIMYLIVIVVKILPSARQETENRKKMVWFMFFFFLLVISLVTAGISLIFHNFSILRYLSFFMSVFIIAQFIFTQRYPFLIQYTSIPRTRKEYSKSHLETMDISSLSEQLNYLMEEEKFFYDEDLTLSRLSQALEITPHQLSQFLNEHHGKNFNTYLNSYRVKESKTMLLEDPTRNTLSVALSVGFNSYSAFFNAFKKEEDMSPAEFRKKNLP